MMMADELLANARGKALIADTGYDSNRFRQAVRDNGMKPVIGSKPERPRLLALTQVACAWLWLEEN
jgi:IS5 family transposase